MPIVSNTPFKIAGVVPQVFTDDFESYTLGQTIYLENTDYTHLPYGGAMTYTSINGSLGSKVLLITGASGSGNRTAMVYTPFNFSNGRLRARVVHSSAGIVDFTTKPGFICRHNNNNSYIYAEMDNETNLLRIVERNFGDTVASVAFSPALDTNYYFEMIFSGTSVIATVYSDSGYSSVVATVNATVVQTGPGTAGVHSRNDSAKVEFDDLEITNNG